jgi:pyruvate dehydrogenase E2 component (dihydrolipoamide acetyltransferase)
MTDILMPALSPTMEVGTLAKWHVKAGDTVAAGDVIAEIETDKATMEVEAVDEGVVDAILVPEGAEGVKVNTPIARLKGEDAAVAPSPEPQKAVAEAAAPAKTEKSEPAPAKSPDKPAAASPAPAAAQPADGERVFASPLARRLAEQSGADLSSIKGSGPHGRIIERDVQTVKPAAAPTAPAPVESKAAPAPAAATPAAAPASGDYFEQHGIPAGTYDLVPLDAMRKVIARRMAASFKEVPHFPLTIDIEIDRLMEARSRINGMLKGEDVRVSVNDIIIKASAMALKRVPDANASYSPSGLAMHHHADVAFAVALDHGLITPIVRAAETKGLAQIAAETKDLAERARGRKLKPDEFMGGTFTVSNLGMFGIKSFASIINEPQGAIMSVGVGEKRPVVRGDQIAIATVMTVTLTCDHRVVDGAIGARFLTVFRAMIDEPLTMLA